MSKIFDAYKKSQSMGVDSRPQAEPVSGPPVAPEVEPTIDAQLFPAPGEKQESEFSKLANRLLGLRQGQKGAIISFASTASGEGSSFVSFHTARVLAKDYGRRVVWVDANFLSPQKDLQDESTPSFSRSVRYPELVVDMKVNGAPHLMPGGDNLVAARGYFASPNYVRLLSQLRQGFDFIILDLPPVLKSTDTALLANQSDGLLLVVEHKYLKWEIINHGIETLREKDVKVLGTVINRREFELPKLIYDRL